MHFVKWNNLKQTEYESIKRMNKNINSELSHKLNQINQINFVINYWSVFKRLMFEQIIKLC